MNASQSRRFSGATLLVPAFTLTMGLSLARDAKAQGHTPDPYNIVGEYNRQYEPYMYATVPNGESSLPNEARLMGGGNRNANQFSNVLDSLDGAQEIERPAFISRFSGGAGVPYYRANRQFDRAFQRFYRPNEKADETYYDEQAKRNDQYFRAMNERDPKKRIELLRSYNLSKMRSARTLSGNRSISDRERSNILERDRFSPRFSASDETDDETPAPIPSNSRPSSSVRRGGSSVSPLPNARSNTAPPPTTGRSSARTGQTSAAATTRRRSTVNSPTSAADAKATEILRRAEMLGTGTRSLAPSPRAGSRSSR